MSSENRFVYNPSTVTIGRSKFPMNNRWKAPIYHGDLVPMEITRVMPGDSIKYKASFFVRTATAPIAPFMDDVWFNCAAFFVPDRIIWNKTKEFYGENTEGYGIQTQILAPRSTRSDICVKNDSAGGTDSRGLATYLGLVRQGSATYTAAIALNPIRSFLQVYNDWFRNENFMAPYLWDHNQTGDINAVIASLSGSSVYGNTTLPKVCKKLDRFTSCLPWAQKGNSVGINLAGLLPLVAGSQDYFIGDNGTATGIIFGSAGGSGSQGDAYIFGNNDNSGILSYDSIDGANKSANFVPFMSASSPNANKLETNLYADGRDVSLVTINELRFAFATQRYLEQLARSGSKYREYIKGIFGVNIGDTTAQMSEYLGGCTLNINVDQVTQTTGYTGDSSTKLGAPGAVSLTAGEEYLFTKSFVEPGYLVVVCYTKHARTYSQGIDEIFLKHEILEEYNPKFAHIGEQAISKANLYFDGTTSNIESKFGFQEAWSEYRHKKDVVIGALAASNSNSLAYWTLADKYTAAPSLTADFLTEDRDEIARALAGGTSSPDYFVDAYLQRTMVRPMPLFSVPGLIDHF